MKYAVIGVGKVGYGAAQYILENEKPEKLGLLDKNDRFISKLESKYGDRVEKAEFAVEDDLSLKKFLTEYDSIICCLPYNFNERIASIAVETGCHYVDLGGNDTVTANILKMDGEAKKAGVSLLPDTGLAPGLVSLIAADFIERFDGLTDISLRVGGLPAEPVPPFNYQVTFSAQGLINEYKEPVKVLRGGREETVRSLTELESFYFPEIGEVEAFTTSGGLSTLAGSYKDIVSSISYKTIRFPGHCVLLNSLRDAGLFDEDYEVKIGEGSYTPRKLLEAYLEQRYTSDSPDMILLYCSAKNGEVLKSSTRFIDRGDSGKELTAMQKCTAIPAAVAAVFQCHGKIKEMGARPQETTLPAGEYLDTVKEWGIDIRREEI